MRGFVRWLAGERVGEWYWTGAWDEALSWRRTRSIAEAEAGTPNFMQGYCHAMRGRIRLATRRPGGALNDAEQAIALRPIRRGSADCSIRPSPSVRGPRFVVGSLDTGAVPRRGAARPLASNLRTFPASAWAVDLAWTLEALGRGRRVGRDGELRRDRTRWLEAVVPYATGDFGTAAQRFAEIGSRPDEAFARLRAAKALLDAGREHEARGELRRAVAFYRAVDATTYLREADSLAGEASPASAPQRLDSPRRRPKEATHGH